MWSRLLCLLAFSILFVAICNPTPLNTNEADARRFVKGISEKVFTYYDRLSRDSFSIYGKKPQETIEKLQGIFKSAAALVDIAQQANAFDISSFHDEELKRILTILRQVAEEAIIGGEEYLGMMFSLVILESTASQKNIKAYRNESVTLAYYPDVHDIFIKSNDPEELKYYWLAWRKQNNKWGLGNFGQIISIIKLAANSTGLNPLEYWLREYNMTEIAHAMTQLGPFYAQLHAFIREQLHKKYGSDVIQNIGLIPDHLYQQVVSQIWTENYVIEEMFPYSELPAYDSLMVKEGYTVPKIFEMADKFYRSLGFTPIPEKIWESQIFSSPVPDEGNCEATIFDMSPNFYMQYCHKMDFDEFLQAHGYMGRLYYAREKRELPAYYFPSYNLEFAVGEAAILSASTPKHVMDIGLVKGFKFTDQVQLNRLLRMSMHTMLSVPLYYVHVKLVADLLSDTIQLEDTNNHYWKLMKAHVGVMPPVQSTNNTLDLPFKFYLDLNENQHAKKFESAIIGYQMYKKLCEISGQYPGDPLYNCDFYGSKSVGNVLKHMMKLGSSKPYKEVLASLMPESINLSVDGLLEYYQRIQTWLTNKNREMNVVVGWRQMN